MKLFTKDIDTKLFEQYAKGSDLENQMVVAKIFNPYGNGTWYLLNSDPEDPEYLWAIVDMGDIEVGSVNRSDLENIKIRPFMLGLERDLSFRPVNALELYKGVNQGKHYAKGGGVDNENREMVLNNNKQIAHHTKEMSAAVRNSKYVPAWVVAKVNRSATDLSDATHYMEGEGESYANGGEIYKHKHMDATAKVIEKTNKGYKVEFTDNSARKPKSKIMYFNDIDFDKDKGYFEKMANGGGIGGTSDSAEMNAPTLGGTMTSSMATGGGVGDELYLVNKNDQFGEKYDVIVNGIKQGSINKSNGENNYFAMSNSTQGGKAFPSKFFDNLEKAKKYVYSKTKMVVPLNLKNTMKQMGYATGGVSKKEFIAKKVGKVMREFKEGDLHIGTSNKIVKNPKQAIAIGLSEGKKGWKHRRK
jgi:hypothetical protein